MQLAAQQQRLEKIASKLASDSKAKKDEVIDALESLAREIAWLKVHADTGDDGEEVFELCGSFS